MRPRLHFGLLLARRSPKGRQRRIVKKAASNRLAPSALSALPELPGRADGSAHSDPASNVGQESNAGRKRNIGSVGPSGWDYCSAPVVLGGAWSSVGFSVQPTIVLMQKTNRQQASRTRRSIVSILSNRNM